MKKKLLRQAIEVTPRQLINIAMHRLHDEYVNPDTKCLFVIINKTGMSDDWRFEK